MTARRLGHTGISVPGIGIGTWPLAGNHQPGDYGSAVDERDAVSVLRHAVDRGLSLIDTAPTYGDGRAEELVGRALARVPREDVVIASKCGVYWDGEAGRWHTDSSGTAIRERVAGSLRRLRVDHLDILLVHAPDRERPVDEVVGALEDLRGVGTIRAWGVSNFGAEELQDYAAHGPVAVQQVGYHMFDRRMERRMFPLCESLDVGVMAFGSLAHGLLAGQITAGTIFDPADWRSKGSAFGLPIFTSKNLPQNIAVVERLAALAHEYGATLPQLALAWVLRQPAVATALVGVRTATEVDDNLGALELDLDAAAAARIEDILAGAAGTSPDMKEYSAT